MKNSRVEGIGVGVACKAALQDDKYKATRRRD
jgi:hypothetical protein